MCDRYSCCGGHLAVLSRADIGIGSLQDKWLVQERQKSINALLRITKKHARILPIEKWVFNAGIARALTTFRDEYLLGLPAFEDRHPGNRTVRIVLRGRIDDII